MLSLTLFVISNNPEERLLAAKLLKGYSQYWMDQIRSNYLFEIERIR
jgi:hypothetical protein